MLGYAIPRRAQLLLFLQVHLCLLSSLGAGAAGLSFSYDFSIPDPGGIHRKDLTYHGGRDNTGRVFYAQPLRLWDGRSGKQASFNTSFSFATMVGGSGAIKNKKPHNGTRRRGRRPLMAFFVGPWPIPSRPPWYWSGWQMGILSDNPTSTFADVEVNTQWDDRGYDPADGVDVAGLRSAARGDDILSAGSTVSVDISYDAGSSMLMIEAGLADGSGGKSSGWAQLNLKEEGLPQDAVVGLAAAGGTGDYLSSPVVVSWSFSSTSTDPSTQLWVIVSSVAIALLAASVLFFIMRKRWAATTVKTELKAAKEVSYQELSTSTNNFSDDLKLGAAGSFGEVHRVALNDTPMAPVAVMEVLTRPMEPQERKDYVTEVTTQRQ